MTLSLSPKARAQRRFGNLIVVGTELNRRGKTVCLCACDCGKLARVLSYNLRNGHTKSCGCLKRELTSRAKTIHGGARKGERDAEYKIWTGILTRCCNEKAQAYERYGGRGIRICDLWRHDYTAFLIYVGRRPSDQHSIDRIDNDGDYEPGNVRWVTAAEQNNNTRRNVLLSEGQVRAIRADGRIARIIAEVYGIERHYVSMIKTRKARRDVD